jgi:hypothetical protein
VYALGLGSLQSGSSWLAEKYPKAPSAPSPRDGPVNLASTMPGGSGSAINRRGSAVTGAGQGGPWMAALTRDFPGVDRRTITLALAKGSLPAARQFLEAHAADQGGTPVSEPLPDGVPPAIKIGGAAKLRGIVKTKLSGGLAFSRMLSANRNRQSERPSHEPAESATAATEQPGDDRDASQGRKVLILTPQPEDVPAMEVELEEEAVEPLEGEDDLSKELDEEVDLICGFRRTPFLAVAISLSVFVAALCIFGLVFTATNTDFPDLRACRLCIGGWGVWNTSQRQCNAALASCGNVWHCLGDASFCGAPECLSRQLLPGVRLIPYWSILLLSIVSVILATVYNIAHRFVLRPVFERFLLRCRVVCSCCHSGEPRQRGDSLKPLDNSLPDENASDELPDLHSQVSLQEQLSNMSFLDEQDDDDTNDLDLLFSFFGMEAAFYLVLLLLATAHFIYVASIVNSYTQNASLWVRYEVLYVTWLNSGTVAVVLIPVCNYPAFIYAKRLLEQRSANVDPILRDFLMEKVKSIWVPRVKFLSNKMLVPVFVAVMVFLWTPIVPILITHTIVGVFVFMPMTLVVVAFWIAAYHLIISRKSDSKVAWIASLGFLRLSGTFSCVFLVQAMTNYMTLFYENKSWDTVFATEFHYRDSRCYYNAIINNLSVHLVGLLGIVLS